MHLVDIGMSTAKGEIATPFRKPTQFCAPFDPFLALATLFSDVRSDTVQSTIGVLLVLFGHPTDFRSPPLSPSLTFQHSYSFIPCHRFNLIHLTCYKKSAFIRPPIGPPTYLRLHYLSFGNLSILRLSYKPITFPLHLCNNLCRSICFI